MEFYTYPSHHFPPSSSPSSSETYSSFGFLVNKIKEFIRCAVSAVVGNVFSAIFTFFFALSEQFLLSPSLVYAVLLDGFAHFQFLKELPNFDLILHIFLIFACCFMMWVPLILVCVGCAFCLFPQYLGEFSVDWSLCLKSFSGKIVLVFPNWVSFGRVVDIDEKTRFRVI